MLGVSSPASYTDWGIVKVRLIILVVALAAALVSVSNPGAETYKKNRWIQSWTNKDQAIWPSIHVAARTFKVSESLMVAIVNGEGGNVNPQKLHASLCSGGRTTGWNTQGSYAFGAFQFMLGSKPACKGNWGTFGSYVNSAFTQAKRLGVAVPYRFKTPSSNVGQSITAAYIIWRGQVCVHWSASLSNC